MNLATNAKVIATGLAVLIAAVCFAGGDPIFVKWLVVGDPGDETIRYYWQQAEAGELGPEELVDLGTMLFYRGWSSDAVTYLRQAAKADPELADAWFRIGLVRHHGGDYADARSAYKKCLKLQSGHAWANFYLGLLEEQTGDVDSAMKHYETAFKHAPELADPAINPEILSSKLQLGAQVRHFDRQRFENTTPMPLLKPAAARKVRRQFEPTPAPEPTPTPMVTIGPRVIPTPSPSGHGATSGQSGGVTGVVGATGTTATRRSAPNSGSPTRSSTGRPATTPGQTGAGATPFGVPTPPPEQSGTGSRGGAVPTIGDTSPEASLRPMWPLLHELAELLI